MPEEGWTGGLERGDEIQNLEKLAALYERGVIDDEELAVLKKRTLGGKTSEREVLHTGLHLLDTRLGGGILSGSVVGLVADPLAMPEVFLYQFCEARETHYFNMERRPRFVMEDMSEAGFDAGRVNFVDVYSNYFLDPHGEFRSGDEYEDRNIVEFIVDRLRKLSMEKEGVNVVFDDFSFFEELKVSWGQVHMMLNNIYEATKRMNGHTYILDHGRSEKVTDLLKSECDTVMSAEVVQDEDAMKKVLYVPKIRGGTPPESGIKYTVDSDHGIRVETGRLV